MPSEHFKIQQPLYVLCPCEVAFMSGNQGMQAKSALLIVPFSDPLGEFVLPVLATLCLVMRFAGRTLLPGDAISFHST